MLSRVHARARSCQSGRTRQAAGTNRSEYAAPAVREARRRYSDGDAGIALAASNRKPELAQAPGYAASAPQHQSQQRAHHQRLQDRIRMSLSRDGAATAREFGAHIHAALTGAGLHATAAQAAAAYIIETLQRQDLSLAQAEAQIHALLKSLIVEADKPIPLSAAIRQMLRSRAQQIFGQIAPYLAQFSDQWILDFGAGDGQVTQLIHDHVSATTVGIDVRPYAMSAVPVLQYDGMRAPFPDASMDCIVLANVLHHDANNRRCLDEVKRVLAPEGGIVMIETVPAGRASAVSFLNEVFYNRCLHDADIPVAGAFETLEGWPARFAAHGFETLVAMDLGIDQTLVQNRHVLYFMRRAGVSAPNPDWIAL